MRRWVILLAVLASVAAGLLLSGMPADRPSAPARYGPPGDPRAGGPPPPAGGAGTAPHGTAWVGAAPSPGAVVGTARVIDGDTLDVAGRRIRLHGIDAPERRQMCERRGGQAYECGEAASRWLERVIAGREVRCAGRDHDRHGRLVAVCRAGGTDLADAMVRNGWAVAYRRFSEAYVPAEAAARSGAKGLWGGGAFDPPETWRRRHGRD